MPAPPADLDDATIARLCHLSDVEFLREEVRWAGVHGELAERGGVLLYATGSDFPVLSNGLIRIDTGLSAVEALDWADAWFAERNRGFTVHTSTDGGVDADLVAESAARDLLEVTGSPVMVCRAPVDEPTVPDGVELRWVPDGQGIDDAVAVNDAAYQSLGMPAGVICDMVRHPRRANDAPLHTVIAYDGDTPLATAQLLLSHGIGGVYYVGTVEAARGRGLAEAATRAVTNRGFALGAAVVTLQATAMGEPVYQRIGYEELYRYAGWVTFA